MAREIRREMKNMHEDVDAVYENGKRIGEIREENVNIHGDTKRVFYDSHGTKVSETTREMKDMHEDVDVTRYEDGSRTETRRELEGLSDHVDVTYDSSGNRVAETRTKIEGIAYPEKVRVVKDLRSRVNQSPVSRSSSSSSSESSDYYGSSGSYSSDSSTSSAGSSPAAVGCVGLLLGGLAFAVLGYLMIRDSNNYNLPSNSDNRNVQPQNEYARQPKVQPVERTPEEVEKDPYLMNWLRPDRVHEKWKRDHGIVEPESVETKK